MGKHEIPKPPPKTSAPPLFSPRGAKLATRLWPVKNFKAVCLIVPGGGWHSGYYAELAESLNDVGIFCASYDPVCMGYSDDEPGTPRGCIHVNEFGDFVEDVFAAAVWTKQQAKDSSSKPFFILGESFGGLQVLAAALDTEQQKQYDVKLAGVVVTGALLEIGDGLLPPKPVIKVLSWLAPYYPRLKMPATDMSATFDEAFGDKEWAAAARKDPGVRVSPHPTLGAAIAMLTCSDDIKANARNFKPPLLAVHAVKDCRTKFPAVQQFVDQVGSHAEGFWLEDTTGHQLLQDRPEVTERVKRKIAEWMKQYV